MPSKPEVIRERRLNDPEFVERHRQASRVWREKNIDSERIRQKETKAKKRAANREAYNLYMRNYNARLAPRRAAIVQQRKEANPEYAERVRTKNALSKSEYEKHWKLKQSYGIGFDEFKALKIQQEHSCAICQRHEKDCGVKGLAIDHCHKEGHVRGLLCCKCNTGLGQFKDDIQLLQRAIEYLTNRSK